MKYVIVYWSRYGNGKLVVETLADKLKTKKVDELNDLNYGVWQGLSIKSIKTRYKKQYSAWKSSPESCRPPKGESLREAYDRTISAMHKIVDKHKEDRVCVVSHDVTISLIQCYLKNVDLQNIWEFAPEKAWWQVFEWTHT